MKTLTPFTVRVLGRHGPNGSTLVEVWRGEELLRFEYVQNHAHAGAWAKGARAALADAQSEIGMRTENPYDAGAPWRRAFRLAWGGGYEAACDALRAQESAR